MKNTVRTLVFGGQVSLTIADTTEMAREAIRRHRLQKTSAVVLCKALSAMTFMRAFRGTEICISAAISKIPIAGRTAANAPVLAITAR